MEPTSPLGCATRSARGTARPAVSWVVLGWCTLGLVVSVVAQEGLVDPHSAGTPQDSGAQADAVLPGASSVISAAARELAQEVFQQHLRPVISRHADGLKTGENLRGIKSQLRVAIDATRDTVATRLKEKTGERHAVLQVLEASLLSELQGLASSPAVASRLTALAVEAKEENDKFHRDRLHGTLICWCPKESWTRTLTGCPDECANEQKYLVARWMREGFTDQEIIDRMVAHPNGGERVRGYDKNWLSFAMPFFLLGVDAALVVATLFTIRRSRSSADGAVASSQEDDAGALRDAARWDGIIEEELKEMDK